MDNKIMSVFESINGKTIALSAVSAEVICL